MHHDASIDLCKALQLLPDAFALILCVDPEGLSALLAYRLIALDKYPGVKR